MKKYLRNVRTNQLERLMEKGKMSFENENENFIEKPKVYLIGNAGTGDVTKALARALQEKSSSPAAAREALGEWICKCGLPMSKNPHPHAGELPQLLNVGAVNVCIPCTVESRHKAVNKYVASDSKVEDLLEENARLKGQLVVEHAMSYLKYEMEDTGMREREYLSNGRWLLKDIWETYFVSAAPGGEG